MHVFFKNVQMLANMANTVWQPWTEPNENESESTHGGTVFNEHSLVTLKRETEMIPIVIKVFSKTVYVIDVV